MPIIKTNIKETGSRKEPRSSFLEEEEAKKRAIASKVTAPQETNPFDTRRQQAVADIGREEERRKEALRNRLGASGIQDVGIQRAQERTLRRDILEAQGRRLGEIDVAEAQQKTAISEADKNRALQERGLGLQEELGRGGLALQQEGLGLQKEGQAFSQDLARRQMGMQQQQIDNAFNLANQGLDLQQSAQQLQAQGMAQQDAQFAASLGQAKALAEKGMDLQAISLDLQRQGLTQQDAQFYANQAFQKELITDPALIQQQQQQALFAIAAGSLDPKDPNFLFNLGELGRSLGLDLPFLPTEDPSAAPPEEAAARPGNLVGEYTGEAGSFHSGSTPIFRTPEGKFVDEDGNEYINNRGVFQRKRPGGRQ